MAGMRGTDTDGPTQEDDVSWAADYLDPVVVTAVAPPGRGAVPAAAMAVVALLLGGVVGLVVVGRSGGTVLDGIEPAAALRQAADAGLASGRYRFSERSGVEGGGTSVSFRFSGLIDPAAQRGRFRFDGKPVDGLEVVQDGPVLYLHRPGHPVDGKGWAKATVTFAAGANPFDANGQAKGVLDQLRSVSTVTDAGTTSIDGVRVRHLHGEVDAAKAVAALGSSATASTTAVAAALPTFPIEVYLDGAGRVRRTTTSATLQGLKVTAQADLTDYGTDQQVVLPDPADVTDLGTDVQGLQSSLTGP